MGMKCLLRYARRRTPPVYLYFANRGVATAKTVSARAKALGQEGCVCVRAVIVVVIKVEARVVQSDPRTMTSPSTESHIP